MKALICLRGCPGAGKTTLAKLFNNNAKIPYHEADKFFELSGTYKFDLSKINEAHQYCKYDVIKSLEENEPIVIVSNTSTTLMEVKNYQDLAEKYGYMFFSLVVENVYNTKDVHSVPQEILDRMKERLKNSIRL